MKIFNYEISERNLEKLSDWLLEYSIKLAAAIFILIIGWWVVKLINKAVKGFFKRKDYDETLERFAADLINWGLKIILFITIVTTLGVKSSSLLAILGAAGLAIGLALQGSLSNFAGGVLILAFKPYKIGDFIQSHGIHGTVKEINIFTTKILTAGNQEAIIPNAKLSNDIITNFNAEPIRKNIMTIGIGYDSDIKQAKNILLNLISAQPQTLKDPEPQVVVANLGDSSVDLSLRFWAKNEDYWELNFYVLEEAKSQLEAAGISIPFPQREVHVYNK